MAQRGTMVKRQCNNNSCKSMFEARQADVNRGWARFCSKSCKAKVQEKRTGQYKDYLYGGKVSRSKRKYYADLYGGIPNFDRHGDYIGFQCTGFDNQRDSHD